VVNRLAKFRGIGERVLSSGAGEARELVVKLARPKFDRGTREFRCTYWITGPGVDVCRYAAGLDSIQAVHLAIIAIGAHVARVGREWGVPLLWQGGDAGFPVP
jgi:hypothetical protein